MAHTDKDMPHWVTAEWWEPWHDRCENGHFTHLGPASCRPNTCNLPTQPVVQHYRDWTWRNSNRNGCHWTPEWPRHHYPHPRHRHIRQVWNGPERAASRDECRRAVAEHRATGTVDTIPSTRQHRHCTRWLWS